MSEIEIKEIPYVEAFGDPKKADELARAVAKVGTDGVITVHHLSTQYLMLALQTIKNGGTLEEARKYEKISINLLAVGDKANNLIQFFDANSDSHILLSRLNIDDSSAAL